MKSDGRSISEAFEVLDAACHGPFTDAWTEVDEKLTTALTDAVAKAAAAHHEVAEGVGLTGEAPDDPHVRSEKLLEYGREVATEVLKTLQQILEHGGPAVGLGRIFTDAHRRAVDECGSVPRTMAIPWPEDALAFTEHDSVWRKVAKPVGRFVSDARRAGEPRAVQTRALAAHHLTRHVVEDQNHFVRATLRVWAQWMGELERAFGTWADRAFPVIFSVEAVTEDGENAETWDVVAEAGRRLEADLEALAAERPHRRLLASARRSLGQAGGLLHADLAVAESFLLQPRPMALTPAVESLERALSLRSTWDAQVVSRIKLHTSLFAILSGASAVQARLEYRMRETCVKPLEVMPEIADRIAGIAESLNGPRTPRPLDISAAQAQAEEALAEALALVPDPQEIEAMVRQGADATVEALQAMVRQVPSELVLHDIGSSAADARGVELRALPLQAMAGQAFDALRMERIRQATQGVTRALNTVSEDANRLTEVVAFGFEAATKEMAEGELDEDGCKAGAELAREALLRTADALRTLPRSMEEAIAETRSDVAEEVAEGCEALFERAGARRVQAQILAARSRFSDIRVGLNETLGPVLRATVRWLRLQWSRLSRRANQGIRWVTGFFGDEPVAQARSSRTLRTLAAADVQGQSAPLVYQKLFTLHPLEDPTLLVGRDKSLDEIVSRWRLWFGDEEGAPTVVVGRSGSGVSSFLNVLIGRLGELGAKTASLHLEHRVYHETQLAGQIAEMLGLEPTETLDGLARALLAAEEGSIPDAVSIDGAEHVYLRAPGGTDLMERLLTFMSETEPRIFWVAGITTSAWQLVHKSEPTAASQVDRVELSPLTPDELRQVIMKRHGRSGLQIRFVEPEGRRLLKRRLRRRRGKEAQQELLMEDFFDQLHRASLGTLRLALFQWLQFAEFDTNDGVVRMHPVDRPDFSLLEALDLTQNFTLKAFIEHGTLTLGEHDAIFRIPRQESYQIFESLGNRHLLEAIDRKEGDRRQSEIVEGLRYRVRPLLTGAVIAHLERRNIVH